MGMVVASKRAKNEIHFKRFQENQQKYANMIIFEMSPLRTKILHDLRDSLRNVAKITFGKKSVMKKVLNAYKDEFKNALTANTFIVFTDADSKSIIGEAMKFNREKTEKIIPSGVLKVQNATAPTVIK